MHYKNGRPAKNGDVIVLLPADTYNLPAVGVFFDGTAGNDYCNGKFAQVNGPAQVNLQECLHLDDVKAVLGDISEVPDTSIAE